MYFTRAPIFSIIPFPVSVLFSLVNGLIYIPSSLIYSYFHTWKNLYLLVQLSWGKIRLTFKLPTSQMLSHVSTAIRNRANLLHDNHKAPVALSRFWASAWIQSSLFVVYRRDSRRLSPFFATNRQTRRLLWACWKQ